MKTKRVIDKRERTTLVVDFETRVLVRYCAKKWGVTMQEATNYLLGRAICEEEGLDFTQSDLFKQMKSQSRNSS
jgi:hypothetical protein